MNVVKWMQEVQIVEGYNRSCIYDLPRTNYEFAPKEVAEFIDRFDGKDENVIMTFNQLELSWFEKFSFSEYIFKIPHELSENFAALNLEWDHPSRIVNAIVEDGIELQKAILFLDFLICKQLLILCEDLERVKEILKENFTVTNFQRVNFVVKGSFGLDDLKFIRNEFPVFGTIFLNSETVRSENENHQNLNAPPFLNIGIELFTESQDHHTYFNRKMFIDRNGYVKNSIETDEIFGKLSDLKEPHEILKIVNKVEFQFLWFVKKEMCDVCKDCELMHMCVDNRVPKMRDINEWYHEVECNYNPYLNKWKGEEGYLNLKESGVITNENEFCINEERIKQINFELWGE